jgi:hypothetical protein
MYEADGFRNNLAFLNDCFERDMQERQERDALIREYEEWCTEEEGRLIFFSFCQLIKYGFVHKTWDSILWYDNPTI